MKRYLPVILACFLFATLSFSANLDLVKVRSVQHHQENDLDNELDEIVTLNRCSDDIAEYYLSSGEIGDTMCVVYEPTNVCSIYSAEIQWFSGGEVEVFIWDYSEEAEEEYLNCQAPNRGTSPVSPLGEVIFGPLERFFEGTQDWETLFDQDDLPDGGIAWGDSAFVVGFVKTQDDGLPQPMADDATFLERTYTWFGGPWMEDYDFYWGAYNSDIENGTITENMQHVVVSYYEGGPPQIHSVSSLPNTTNPEKICEVFTVITDDTGWDTDEAWLVLSVNGEEEDQILFAGPDQDNLFTVEFDLSAYGVTFWDEISYYVVAEDEEGNINSTENSSRSFDIVEIQDPDAELLLITENFWLRQEVIITYLEDADVSYEYWSIEDNNGIDRYLVEAGFPLVAVFAEGNGCVPLRGYGDDSFSGFLESMGDFILVDSDWFYANGEEEEVELAEGDFAYDFLGIMGGSNDPVQSEVRFLGVEDHPVSGPFWEECFEILFEEFPTWTDELISTEDGEEIFYGENSGEPTAITTESPWQKTAYFAFDALSSCEMIPFPPHPDGQLTTLLDNLLDWIESYNYHYVPVDYTGIFYPVNVDLITINETELELDCEVAIFDDDLCVGNNRYRGNFPFEITTCGADPELGLEGYLVGNEMSFSVWLPVLDQELTANAEFLEGNGEFGSGDFASVILSLETDLPQISIPEMEYNFGDVRMGDIRTWEMEIDNIGAAQLVIPSISSDHLAFTVNMDEEITIDPGGHAFVEVIYSPTVAGPDSCNLVIETNDIFNPSVNVVLEGMAVPNQPPSDFNLLEPENLEMLSVDDFANLLFRWELSMDPNPGDTVLYSLNFSVAEDEQVLGELVFDNLQSREYTLNLPDSMNMQYWENLLMVTWWVTAISPPDTVESESEFLFFVEPNSDVPVDPFNDLPAEYSIAAAYPNPFNSTMNIVVGLPEKSKLSVIVYNILGERVKVLADGLQPAGYQTFIFNDNGLSSGLYFVQCQVPGKMEEIRKTILIR